MAADNTGLVVPPIKTHLPLCLGLVSCSCHKFLQKTTCTRNTKKSRVVVVVCLHKYHCTIATTHTTPKKGNKQKGERMVMNKTFTRGRFFFEVSVWMLTVGLSQTASCCCCLMLLLLSFCSTHTHTPTPTHEQTAFSCVLFLILIIVVVVIVSSMEKTLDNVVVSFGKHQGDKIGYKITNICCSTTKRVYQ